MFGWLQRLFSRERIDTYRPGERRIYIYFDGKKLVHADPIVIYKRMMNYAPEIDADIRAMNFPGFSGGTKAHGNLVKNLKEVFKVTTFEEDGGLTESEILNLLDHFLAYCDDLKKNSSLSPMLSVPTATSASSPASPPTGSTSDSGSTAAGPSTAPPGPSPSVPESPSAP